MWKYIDDGSGMGAATVVALAIATSIVLVGWTLAILDVLRRSRVVDKDSSARSIRAATRRHWPRKEMLSGPRR